MPKVDGIEATRRILAGPEPRPRVLVLTTFDLDEYVFAALRAGASGFLLKDAPEEQLGAAIRIAAEGGSMFAPSVTRRLIERFAGEGETPAPPALDELTARELEVLRMLARGLSNARDRGGAGGQRAHGEDACRPRPREARPARPGPGGRPRVRVRARTAARPRVAHVA